jgi:cell division protein FtsB
MPTVSESIAAYVEAQTAVNDQQDKAVDGLAADVKFLNDTITTLQNSPGTLTPADQASLDALQARGKAIADKLTALDALTNPEPPTV